MQHKPFTHDPSLVEINQNVTTPFTTTCNLQSFATRFANICNFKPKFHPIGWIDFTFIFIHY